jgi:ribosomal protein S18 acetylase RimI-like enzyme
MYSLWADNSLNGMLADAVLVERAEGGIVGMITVKYRGEIGQIGLFSVDQMYRGRRIGSRLLNVAMKRCHAGGCKQILVVTQRQNSASCRFYERVGFHVANEQAVFHFWVGQT